MMVNPYDDSRLMLALQIDHSRVAGYFAAHWGNQDFARPEPYTSVVLAANGPWMRKRHCCCKTNYCAFGTRTRKLLSL